MDTPTDAKGARYDQIADWYVAWTSEWRAGFVLDPAAGLATERVDGQRWLDVACGAGRTSRELARRGAEVVGVDLSASLIAVAKAEESADPLGVSYRAADITRLAEWWDGRGFDGAVCEMALMDIDDLGGALDSVAQVLRAEGRFLVSLVHPCLPCTEHGLSSWPPELGYQAEGFWTSSSHNPEGVRIRVGSSHRTLATYLNVLVDHGFHIERTHEPVAPVPMWLVLALRRK